MMNLAQAEGGVVFDPTVLPGPAAPVYLEWKWQGPKPLIPQSQDGSQELSSSMVC